MSRAERYSDNCSCTFLPLPWQLGEMCWKSVLLGSSVPGIMSRGVGSIRNNTPGSHLANQLRHRALMGSDSQRRGHRMHVSHGPPETGIGFLLLRHH